MTSTIQQTFDGDTNAFASHADRLVDFWFNRQHTIEAIKVRLPGSEAHVTYLVATGEGRLFIDLEAKDRTPISNTSFAGHPFVLLIKPAVPCATWTVVAQMGFTKEDVYFRVRGRVCQTAEHATTEGRILRQLILSVRNAVPLTRFTTNAMKGSSRNHLIHTAPRITHPNPHLFSGDVIEAVLGGVKQNLIYTRNHFVPEGAPYTRIACSEVSPPNCVVSSGHVAQETITRWAKARNAIAARNFRGVSDVYSLDSRVWELYRLEALAQLRRVAFLDGIHLSAFTNEQLTLLLNLLRNNRDVHVGNFTAVFQEYTKMLSLGQIAWGNLGNTDHP